MPSNSYTDKNGNTKYNDVFHAITAEARTELNNKVLEAYEQALEKQQDEDESESEEDSMTQTM